VYLTVEEIDRMPQKILDHSYIDPFVDQNVAATVPQHMRVQLQVLKVRCGGHLTNHDPDCHPTERTPALANEEFLDGRRRIHFPALD